ncbi:hypothetical protein N0V88_007350 [Collariella sp. IMI 366227]|nr:hypothetical protein N0V88_007350 [Collariella sp. IMI 366227]
MSMAKLGNGSMATTPRESVSNPGWGNGAVLLGKTVLAGKVKPEKASGAMLFVSPANMRRPESWGARALEMPEPTGVRLAKTRASLTL